MQLEEKYNILLKYVQQEAHPNTFCGLHEAIQNEIIAREARKVLEKIEETW